MHDKDLGCSYVASYSFKIFSPLEGMELIVLYCCSLLATFA